MSTKDVMKEILKEYKKFIKAGKDKKKFINSVNDLLEKNGINVTIRREMGRDIDGACGQLRRRHKASQ